MIDTKAPLTLGDLFAALPGTLLLVGYGVALILSSSLYADSVELDQHKATYDVRYIDVPQPHADSEQPTRTSRHPVRFPRLDQAGKPLISVEMQSFKGKGNPRVVEETSEVLVPKIGDPPLLVTKTEEYVPPPPNSYGPPGPGTFYTKVSYTPQVTYRGTGIYEIRKVANFDVGFDRERYAVIGGVIGSVISLVYFIWRLAKGTPNTEL